MTDFANLELRVDSRSVKTATGDVKEFQRAAGDADKKASSSFNKTSQSAKILKGAIAAIATTQTLRGIINYSENWKAAENQLRLVTSSASELAATQNKLLNVANETRTAFGSTAELYSKLDQSTQSLNLSQGELIGLTTTINQAVKATGGDAASTAAAVTQLSQAFSSGVLRGEEFNSVSEQAPLLLMALQDSLGVTRGELREMAQQGQLTSDVLIKGFQDSAQSIEEKYLTAVVSLGDKMTIARNNMGEFIGSSEIVDAVLSGVGDAAILASKNLEQIAEVAGTLGAVVLAAKLIPAITATTGSMVAAQIQAVRYQATLAAMAGVSGRAAAGQIAFGAASRGASVALGLLGGPIGATIIALGLLAKHFWEVEKAQKAAFSEAAAAASAQGINALNALIETNQESIVSLLEQMRILEEDSIAMSVSSNRRRFAQMQREVQDLMANGLILGKEKVELIEATQRAEEEALKQSEKNTRQEGFAADATELVNRKLISKEDANRSVTASMREQITEYKALIQGIQDETEEYNLSGTALELFNIEKSLNVQLSKDQIAELTPLIEKLQAEKDAAAAAEAAEAERSRVTRENIATESQAMRAANREAQRAWVGTRDYMADFFTDLVVNGNDAWDSLAKAAEAAAIRAVAQWAASGLLDMLGFNNPFGSGGGSGILGGLFGSGGSAGGNSLGGSGGVGGAGVAKNAFGVVRNGANLVGQGLNLVGLDGGGIAGQWLSNSGIGGRAIQGPVQPGAEGLGVTGANYGRIGANLLAGAAGAFVGDTVGEALFNKEANSAFGAAAGGTIGSYFGPWGTAIGAAVGALVDVASGGDGYQRFNAGILVGATPGIEQDQVFNVDPFQSGFRPTGFSEGVEIAEVLPIINQFRGVDAAITELVTQLGGGIDLSNATLNGLGQDGQLGTQGTFLGIGGKTSEADFPKQLDLFATQIVEGITGLDENLKNAVLAATTGQEIINLLVEALPEKGSPEAKALEEAQKATQENTESTSRSVQDLVEQFNSSSSGSAGVTFDPVTSETLSSIDTSIKEQSLRMEEALRRVEAALMDLSDSAGASLNRILDVNLRELDEMQRWTRVGLNTVTMP